MTDYEYTCAIYCLVFSVASDCGDADTQGILDAIDSLEAREQLALESYFRHGNTYKQTAAMLGGVSNETARRVVQKALLKLRHTSRSRYMCLKAVSKRQNNIRSAIEAHSN